MPPDRPAPDAIPVPEKPEMPSTPQTDFPEIPKPKPPQSPFPAHPEPTPGKTPTSPPATPTEERFQATTRVFNGHPGVKARSTGSACLPDLHQSRGDTLAGERDWAKTQELSMRKVPSG
jgi:hypothetical protein